MKPDAVLINKPTIDFTTFLGLSHRALGYSLTDKADLCPRELSDAERFLSYLAAMRDAKAPVGFVPSLLAHVSFSVFVAADERDMLAILQCAAGMPFVVANTIANNIQIAVITGTLAQWRDAVRSGSDPTATMPVRQCFNRIFTLFEAADLSVWADFCARTAPDQQTFYLEDKRNR